MRTEEDTAVGREGGAETRGLVAVAKRACFAKRVCQGGETRCERVAMQGCVCAVAELDVAVAEELDLRVEVGDAEGGDAHALVADDDRRALRLVVHGARAGRERRAELHES